MSDDLCPIMHEAERFEREHRLAPGAAREMAKSQAAIAQSDVRGHLGHLPPWIVEPGAHTDEEEPT